MAFLLYAGCATVVVRRSQWTSVIRLVLSVTAPRIEVWRLYRRFQQECLAPDCIWIELVVPDLVVRAMPSGQSGPDHQTT